MVENAEVGFQGGRIGYVLRTAALERGIRLSLLGPHDVLPKEVASAEVRLADGSMCGALWMAAPPTPHDWNVMSRLALALADDIEENRALSSETLGARVRHVIDSALLRVVLQPIVELESMTTVGLESLARFPSHATEGPGYWFAEAETAGLGAELELAAVGAALAAMGDVRSPLYISVNVSPETIATDQFAALLEGSSLDRLVIEVTEHSPIRDYAGLRRIVDGFRGRGARLAIDDAGAGFASLNHVVALEPDIIKLDLSLIRGIDRDATKRSLVRSLSGFAREVGALVVAEGIETGAELSALTGIGIQFGQGFLLGRPSPSVPPTGCAEVRPPGSAIARSVDEQLLENMAAELGLPVEEVRSLSSASRSTLWRRLAFDDLTGVLQRAQGMAALEREVSRASRHGEPLTVVFIDLDHLKTVNDSHGHQAGDRVLQRFAAAAASCMRREDFLFRYGGDEFVCVLPATPADRAALVTHRIREATRPLAVSFSAGIAERQEDEGAPALLMRADAAMYSDKHRRQVSDGS